MQQCHLRFSVPELRGATSLNLCHSVGVKDLDKVAHLSDEKHYKCCGWWWWWGPAEEGRWMEGARGLLKVLYVVFNILNSMKSKQRSSPLSQT